MRLAMYADTTGPGRLAVLRGDDVLDLPALYDSLAPPGGPDHAALADMVAFFSSGARGRELVDHLVAEALGARAAGHTPQGPDGRPAIRPVGEVRLLPPVARPPRIRDYLTYRQHASGAGVKVPPAFEAMPICYQCNADSVIGPDDVIPWPPYTEQLDYELELGFFVGPGGRDLTVDEADAHIAGVTLFNDVSARDIQFLEMSMTIGPSKGKDFCNVLGPCVLTMDEVGEYGMELTARVNGEVWSRGTTADRQFSFAEVLAWASYGEDVQPGEFLAVGTVGGGCGAELDRWIQPGDLVELEASGVGVLRNRIGARQPTRPGAGLASYQGAPPFHPPSRD